MPNLIEQAGQGAKTLMTPPSTAPRVVPETIMPPSSGNEPLLAQAPQGQAPTQPTQRATPDPGIIPGGTAPSVNPTELGYGDNVVAATANAVFSVGDNIIPSIILATKYQDLDYMKAALAGHKVDLDKEWDAFGMHNHWAPWAIGTAKFATNIAASPSTYLTGGAAKFVPANAIVDGLGFLGSKATLGVAGKVAPQLVAGATKTVANGALNGLDLFRYGLTTSMKTGASNGLGAFLARTFGWYTNAGIDTAADLARFKIAGELDGPVGMTIAKLNQSSYKVAQSLTDDLVTKGLKPGDAKELVSKAFATNLENADYILAHYYPDAVGKTAQAIKDDIVNSQTELMARATSLGLTPQDIQHLGLQTRATVGEYEQSLKALTDQAQRTGTKVRLGGAGSTQEAIYQAALTKYNYRLVGDFARVTTDLTKNSNPEVAVEALNIAKKISTGQPMAEIATDVYNLVGKLPPVKVESLISNGSLAKLPIHDDTLTDIILGKVLDIDPSIHISEKTLAVGREQLEVFKHNPMVAVNRSIQTMLKDLKQSSFSQNMVSQGVADGWAKGGKTAGFVTLPEDIVQLLGDHTRGVYFDPQAAAAITNFVGTYKSPEGLGKLLQGFDEIVGGWKMGVLSNPKTQLNNLTGNTLQYHMGRGNLGELPTALKQLQTILKDPVKAYKDPALRELIDNGVIGGKTIQGAITSQGVKTTLPEALKGYLVPSTKTGLVPELLAKNMVSFNGFLDDMYKIGLYRTYRSQGMDGRTALRKLQGFYYNDSPMSQLTEVEREVFSRVVPFYRWMKNNIPGQIRNLFVNPAAAGKQISLALGLGVMGGNASEGPLANPQGISTIDYRTGETVNYRNINVVPALDAWNVYQGLALAATSFKAEGLGEAGAQLVMGLSQATQLGPAGGGVSPALNLAGSISKLAEEPKASNLVKVVTDNVPGVANIARILKAVGVTDTGKVEQGVFTKPVAAKPGLLPLSLAPTTERRDAREALTNWLGQPTAQLATLNDFKKLDSKAMNRFIKAYEKAIPDLAKNGERELAGMLGGYVEKLKAYQAAKAMNEEIKTGDYSPRIVNKAKAQQAKKGKQLGEYTQAVKQND